MEQYTIEVNSRYDRLSEGVESEGVGKEWERSDKC